MAEQLKLFEDILPLNGTKEKRDLTEKKMVKETKPYYLHNPKTKNPRRDFLLIYINLLS